MLIVACLHDARDLGSLRFVALQFIGSKVPSLTLPVLKRLTTSRYYSCTKVSCGLNIWECDPP